MRLILILAGLAFWATIAVAQDNRQNPWGRICDTDSFDPFPRTLSELQNYGNFSPDITVNSLRRGPDRQGSLGCSWRLFRENVSYFWSPYVAPGGIVGQNETPPIDVDVFFVSFWAKAEIGTKLVVRPTVWGWRPDQHYIMHQPSYLVDLSSDWKQYSFQIFKQDDMDIMYQASLNLSLYQTNDIVLIDDIWIGYAANEAQTPTPTTTPSPTVNATPTATLVVSPTPYPYRDFCGSEIYTTTSFGTASYEILDYDEIRFNVDVFADAKWGDLYLSSAQFSPSIQLEMLFENLTYVSSAYPWPYTRDGVNLAKSQLDAEIGITRTLTSLAFLSNVAQGGTTYVTYRCILPDGLDQPGATPTITPTATITPTSTALPTSTPAAGGTAWPTVDNGPTAPPPTNQPTYTPNPTYTPYAIPTNPPPVTGTPNLPGVNQPGTFDNEPPVPDNVDWYFALVEYPVSCGWYLIPANDYIPFLEFCFQYYSVRLIVAGIRVPVTTIIAALGALIIWRTFIKTSA